MSDFTVIFNETDLCFDVEFGEVLRYEVLVGDITAYEGEYTITPTVNGRVLETAKKYMKDDLTIEKIPYHDVGNNSGGSTVYIANEID